MAAYSTSKRRKETRGVFVKLRFFEMERWQSTWENEVEYNLSESGVHPLHVNELLEGADNELLNHPLGYTQTNGTVELRKAIASMYPNAQPGNVLVTNGSAEAIFVAMWSFLDRDAEIVIMLPNYMQVWGLTKTFGARLKTFKLREEEGEWLPDLRGLKKVVTKKTKLIAICNPNNPTGTILHDEAWDEICTLAKKANAWILSDEVYQGAELDGKTTSSVWGRHDKVIVTNGLSKAYGLPGLRIGWLVTTSELAEKLWAYHDYTTIGPSAMSDYLARKALRPDMRSKILERTREHLRTNLPVMKEWVERHRENFCFVPPRAGAIAYLKYKLRINSTTLAQRLMKEKSTLIVPGDHFGMDGYVRIGYGPPKEYLVAGLNRVDEMIRELERKR